MPSNIELKVDTSVGPNQAQAKMLLTWIGEYRPDLLTWAVEQINGPGPDAAPALTPAEQVDMGVAEGVQLSIEDGAAMEDAALAARELADLGATVTASDDGEEE